MILELIDPVAALFLMMAAVGLVVAVAYGKTDGR
jgi:hypothetical protein